MIIKLPFGLRDGKLIHISEIAAEQNGLKCNCICPECGEKLVARKGNIRVHHFAHNNENCINPLETVLHYYAKEVLAKYKKIKLPPVELEYRDYKFYNHGKDNFYYTTSIEYETIYNDKMIEFDTVECEQYYGNIKPDIIVYSGNTPLFIEIAVTNFIDDEKLKKIEKIGISTLEIFLDKDDFDFYNFDKEELENTIINSTRCKFWVYNRIHEKMKLKKSREIECYKKLEHTKHMDSLEKNQKKHIERIERIKRYKDDKFRADKLIEFNISISEDPIWIKNSRELGISLNRIPEFLNIEVFGEFSINCDRRTWQSSIFNKFIKDRKGQIIKVNNVVNWVKKYSGLKLNKDLIYTKNIDEVVISDLSDCIYNYLLSLEDYTILTCKSNNHNFYAEFIVSYGGIQNLIGLSKNQIKKRIISDSEIEDETKNKIYSLITNEDLQTSKINTTSDKEGAFYTSNAAANPTTRSYNSSEKSEPKRNIKAHPLLWREGICKVCGNKTSDWVSFDGSNNTCLCRECASK